MIPINLHKITKTTMMKSKFYKTEKNNGFDNQFPSLNNVEMMNLRGGTVPPDLPPGGGEDFPIDPYRRSMSSSLTTNIIVIS